MEFIVGLSSYVLGNLRAEELPDFAVIALEEGYDTPSLRILAGLDNDVWEIAEYLELSLKEMGIKLPSQIEAGLILIKYHIQKIVDKEIEPVEGIGKVIAEVLRKTSCFNGNDKKYAYDYIGFSKLYGLFYEFEDMVNPLVMVSDEYRRERNVSIKDEILYESAAFLKDFGGDQLHLTEYCRNFVKMDVVGTLRQYSGRSTTYRAKAAPSWRGREEF